MKPPSTGALARSFQRITDSTAPVGFTVSDAAWTTCSSRPSTSDASAAAAVSPSSAKWVLPAPPRASAARSVSS